MSTSATGNLASSLGTAAAISGIASGIASGKPAGETSAALSAAGLLNSKTGAVSSATGLSSGTVSNGLGAASGVLGLATGLQQGGVSGYGSAAVGGLRAGAGVANLAGDTSVGSTLSSAAGALAVPLSLYNTVSNFKPGATASDALNAASTGAAIGSIIPGVGTVIGGLVGGAVGAIASEFGGSAGSKSEIQPFLNASTQFRQNNGSLSTLQNPYLALAGLFSYTPTEMSSTYGNNPIYQQFGRNGEGPFVEAMTSEINNAYKAGTIKQGATASDIMNSVVNPWIQSFGKGNFGNESQQGQITGAIIQQAVQQYITGQAPSQWKAVGGDSPFANNNLIQSYAGYTPPSTASTTATPQQASIGNISSSLSGLI